MNDASEGKKGFVLIYPVTRIRQGHEGSLGALARSSTRGTMGLPINGQACLSLKQVRWQHIPDA